MAFAHFIHFRRLQSWCCQEAKRSRDFVPSIRSCIWPSSLHFWMSNLLVVAMQLTDWKKVTDCTIWQIERIWVLFYMTTLKVHLAMLDYIARKHWTLRSEFNNLKVLYFSAPFSVVFAKLLINTVQFPFEPITEWKLFKYCAISIVQIEIYDFLVMASLFTTGVSKLFIQ